jgi:solute carrier family 25 protein 14/30
MSSVRGDLAYIDVRHYIYGGTAAVVAEICTFPLDTAKTRLQLQGSAAHPTAYSGTADCLYTVARHEGVARLYRGLSPAVVRQAVYGTIKYGLYYSVKDVVMWRWGVRQESTAVNVFCGIVAGELLANSIDIAESLVWLKIY